MPILLPTLLVCRSAARGTTCRTSSSPARIWTKFTYLQLQPQARQDPLPPRSTSARESATPSNWRADRSNAAKSTRNSLSLRTVGLLSCNSQQHNEIDVSRFWTRLTTTAPRDQLPIQDAFSRQKALLQGFVSWSCIVVEINADTSLVTLSFLMPTLQRRRTCGEFITPSHLLSVRYTDFWSRRFQTRIYRCNFSSSEYFPNFLARWKDMRLSFSTR